MTVGAREGSRTPTVARWILNPVRLPIPPLSLKIKGLAFPGNSLVKRSGRRGKRQTRKINGVSEGVRTLDNWSHNPVLYRLSYTHHEKGLQFSQGPGACQRLTRFHTEAVLFRPGGVNLQACLCGVPLYASAQTLDFLTRTKNSSLPHWKPVFRKDTN